MNTISNQNLKFSALCCYFGKWPTTFQQWLDTAHYNPRITFFIISDIVTEILHDAEDDSIDSNNNRYYFPKNVKLISMSFNDFKNRIIKSLKEICPSLNGDVILRAFEKPYKICDLKPLYGLVFNDIKILIIGDGLILILYGVI